MDGSKTSRVFWFNRKYSARFISHQWAGLDHPDPTLEQFRAPGLEKRTRFTVVKWQLATENTTKIPQMVVNSKGNFVISGKPRLVNSLVFRSFPAKRISQLGKTGWFWDSYIFEYYLGRVDSNSSSFAGPKIPTQRLDTWQNSSRRPYLQDICFADLEDPGM